MGTGRNLDLGPSNSSGPPERALTAGPLVLLWAVSLSGNRSGEPSLSPLWRSKHCPAVRSFLDHAVFLHLRGDLCC